MCNFIFSSSCVKECVKIELNGGEKICMLLAFLKMLALQK